MSDPRPQIVVTLPGRSLGELRREVELARSAGADLAEVRADRLSASDRDRLAGLFPSPLPLVATFRSRVEGGEGPDDPAERAEVLAALARLPFRWIDLEVRRDGGVRPRLPPVGTVGRIFSLHPGPTAPGAWEGLLRELDEVEGVGKLVVPAAVSDFLGTLVPLLERSRGAEVVALTTGPSGPLSRALARRFGFPLVYAALPVGSSGPPVEPSQVPVDRLRPFLAGEPAGPVFAVAGHPVGHSRSPAVHSVWMRGQHRQGIYVALDFADEGEFVASLASFERIGLRGLNVTSPYKRAALEASTQVGAGARASGAVNCLTLDHGEWVGENTDLVAILRRLGELKTEGLWDGHALSVLGGGGAARATLAAARELSASATVFARRAEAAAELARELGATAGPPRPTGPVRLVVHATDVGRSGRGHLDLPFDTLVGPGTHVVDWVYGAEDPSLQRAAERAGATYENGWRLFVYQAAASYALWWGEEPPAALVRETLAGGVCAA